MGLCREIFLNKEYTLSPALYLGTGRRFFISICCLYSSVMVVFSLQDYKIFLILLTNSGISWPFGLVVDVSVSFQKFVQGFVYMSFKVHGNLSCDSHLDTS